MLRWELATCSVRTNVVPATAVAANMTPHCVTLLVTRVHHQTSRIPFVSVDCRMVRLCRGHRPYNSPLLLRGRQLDDGSCLLSYELQQAVRAAIAATPTVPPSCDWLRGDGM